jgi:hypothetical protein
VGLAVLPLIQQVMAVQRPQQRSNM